MLDNLPLNATIKSVLAHRDSVMPNDLRIRVQSIITDLNKQLEEEWKNPIQIMYQMEMSQMQGHNLHKNR